MDMDNGRMQQPAQGLHEQQLSNSLVANDVDFGAPSLSPPPFQLQASDGFEEEQEAAGMGFEGLGNGGFASPTAPPSNEDDSSDTLQLQSATAAFTGGGAIQRTTFKLASTGDEAPEFHTTDPQKFASRTSDTLVEKSLHEYKIGETVMQVATSPITIFMHGSTLAKFTAEKFFKYITARGFAPQAGTEIVFITCKGALQEDEFFVSKGQALADKLQATVHLARGNVRINSDGVPVVAKANGSGDYPHIESKEEMARIIPKNSEGWRTYRPQGVTFKEVQAHYKKARRELRKYLKFEMAKADVTNKLEEMAENVETLKTDRRDIVDLYEYNKLIEAAAKELWGPRQAFFEELQRVIMDLELMKMDTVAHKGRANDIIAEFTGWADNIRADNSKDNKRLEGFKLLLADKRKDWVEPLAKEIEEEKGTAESKESVVLGSGWEDSDDEDFWANLGGLESKEQAESEETTTGTGTETSTETSTDTSSGSTGTEKSSAAKNGSAVQAKMAPGSGVVQRQVIDKGGALKDGRHLEDLLDGLPNMDLVRGNDNLDLVLRFADIPDEGVTKVYMNGTAMRYDDYVPANARKKFVIAITLDSTLFSNGQDLSKMGNLIETITHEWMLHGQQHAVNINSLRYNIAPDAKLDHEYLFHDRMSQMDIAIALQMGRPANAAFKDDIGVSYLKDVQMHKRVITKGWNSDDMSKSKKFHQLLTEIKLVYDKQAKLKSDKPELHAKLESFLGEVEWYLEEPYEYDSFDGLDCADLSEQLEAIAAEDTTGLVGLIDYLETAIQGILPLLENLETVLRANSDEEDILDVRRQSLATLGVNAGGLEFKAGRRAATPSSSGSNSLSSSSSDSKKNVKSGNTG